MKILTIVGARPQFIKAAPVSRAIRKQNTETLVHTGQHYDDNMSGVFFRELGIPAPDYNLEVGSGGHGEQTGLMLQRLEPLVEQEQPDLLLVYGDTNSTLAGALTAAKLHIPLAHVEAGLRSFDRRMPEEINRVVADQLSNLLFCPTLTAVDNLKREGIGSNEKLDQHIYEVGDVMYDAVLHNLALAETHAVPQLASLGVKPQGYTLATVHRAASTDDADRLRSIVAALAQIGSKAQPVIFPVHPRTRKVMATLGIVPGDKVRLIEPVGYLEMLNLERNARLIITDSGGVQKEAYFLAVPCLTLRDETEWVETVASGWNRLVGTDTNKIVTEAQGWAQGSTPTDPPPPLFGNGHAGERIAEMLARVKNTDSAGA